MRYGGKIIEQLNNIGVCTGWPGLLLFDNEIGTKVLAHMFMPEIDPFKSNGIFHQV